jgi:hypothetical protein
MGMMKPATSQHAQYAVLVAGFLRAARLLGALAPGGQGLVPAPGYFFLGSVFLTVLSWLTVGIGAAAACGSCAIWSGAMS